MNTFIKRVGLGVIAWVIPYVSAIPLLPLSTSNPAMFHLIVSSVATITASVLAIYHFSGITSRYLRESLWLSVTWVVVNWALDIVALLPFTKQTIPQYFFEMGIWYIALMAPIVAMGYILGRKLENGMHDVL